MNYTRTLHRCASVSAQFLGVVIMLAIAATTLTVSAQNKITAEQVVAKHLESIGSDKARRDDKSRIIFGNCTAVFRGIRTGTLTGRTVLASEGNRSLIGISFESPDYPHEKIGYDGDKFRVGFITPGRRTALGTFLLNNDGIYKEGLVGGTLSSAWSLLDTTVRGAKLAYVGTEKLNNRPVHKVRYTPRRSFDLQVTLYFDAENFRHVRTLYERVVGANLGGGVDASAGLRETRFKLEENFSEFKKEGDLTLPHKYELELFIDGTNGTIAYNYLMNLERFSFNQEIGAEFFNAEAS